MNTKRQFRQAYRPMPTTRLRRMLWSIWCWAC